MIFYPLFSDRLLVEQSLAYRLSGDEVKSAAFAQQALDLAIKLNSTGENDSASEYDNASELLSLTQAYLMTGQTAEALEISERAKKLRPESSDSLSNTYYSEVHVWVMAMAGLRDEALIEIERLLNTPAGLNRWNLYLDPRWDFFRDDERFNELIRPLNLEEGTG